MRDRTSRCKRRLRLNSLPSCAVCLRPPAVPWYSSAARDGLARLARTYGVLHRRMLCRSPAPSAFRTCWAIAIRITSTMSELASIPDSPRASDRPLILAIGPRLGEVTTGGYTLLQAPYPQQKLVHIHAAAEELGRIYQADLMINSGMPQMLLRCQTCPRWVLPRGATARLPHAPSWGHGRKRRRCFAKGPRA